MNNTLYFFVLASLSVYFLGNTGYSNHLVYFIYFFVFFIANIKKEDLFVLLACFVLVASGSLFVKSYEKATFNIRNYESVQANYPLYKLSKELKNYIGEDSSVFALDSVMILFYLDKQNYSHIVHPPNHFLEWITAPLIRYKKIRPNNVDYLISTKPDVIICNSVRIHKGELFKNEDFDCNFENFSDEYINLDTTDYITDRRISYFYDPYKDLNVFVKKQNN